MERIEIKKLVFILVVLFISAIIAVSFYSKEVMKNEPGKELIKNLEGDKLEQDLSRQEHVSWANKALLNDFKKKEKVDYKIKIAVLDSGIDEMHPDLIGQIKKKYNAIDQKDQIKDEFGHGTAVAGIIAAKHNGIGIKGINPDAEIYAVKVSDDKGVSEIDSLVKGIEWCIQEKVHLINISLGLSSHSDKLERVINEAINSGIVIVASAGNNYMTWTDYPAKYQNVISVNAVTNEYIVDETYAGYGKIDFVAPGKDIVSTVPGNRYKIVAGTSIATAFVTGITSLMMAENMHELKELDGKAKVEKVISLLKEKAISIGDSSSYGFGFIKY